MTKIKRNIVAVFKPHGQGLRALFGSLEADIMTLIWERQDASARDIFEALRDRGQQLSYETVKTVMDRLVKKQVLSRGLDGNHYHYQAQLNREEFMGSAIHEILDGLLASFGTPAYMQLLAYLRATDLDQLDELMRAVDAAEAKKNQAEK